MNPFSKEVIVNVKKSFLGIMLGLGLALSLLALLGIESPSHAAPNAERHVCPSGCAYASIQEAVDAADPGDVIKVAGGTYTGIHVRDGMTQVVYISESISLQGGYTTSDWNTPDPSANPTTIDAQGQGQVLVIMGFSISPTVQGLRLTGGDATLTDRGGGLYIVNAGGLISDNVIYSNTSPYYGGGVHLTLSDATLQNNLIQSNTAGIGVGGGGGIYLEGSDATLKANTIQANAGRSGGGVHVGSSNAQLEGNVIRSNDAAIGGGLYAVYSEPTLDDNLIQNNTASSGGGVYLYASSPRFVNNVIADNQITYQGTGLYVLSVDQSSAPRLLHTTLARNTGGDGSGIHVTDDGYGAYSQVLLTNTVLVEHSLGITVSQGSTATLNATLWHANGSNWAGAGFIQHTNDHNGDPAFDADGYHLITGSMAIDRGLNAGVSSDVDGQKRPQGGGYDLGADEFPATALNTSWDKQVRVNGGASQAWDSGPFDVAPGDTVTIVDRVWVTGTGSVSFTLGEAWSGSLDWQGYQSSVGSVSQAGRTATWSVPSGGANSWHVLTTSLNVLASPDDLDRLTETLTVQGAAYQLPERAVEFRHAQPQPTWSKSVRVNGGAFQNWSAGPFLVEPGDDVTIVDRVRITHTSDVSLTLAQSWGAGLDLRTWSRDAGTIVTGTGRLTWQGSDLAPDQWHSLTTTWRVQGTTWLHQYVTQTLAVQGAAIQPGQRVVDLLNLGASTGCHARVNGTPTDYPTVQLAVDAAQPGDLVKVAGHCSDVNHYGGSAQVVYLSKTITLQGGYTAANWSTPDPEANPTTLDAQGQGRVMVLTGDVAPTVQGLRITGGDAEPEDRGGGLYLVSSGGLISGNVIYSNTTPYYGGGVYASSASAVLRHNLIQSNTAGIGVGGGGGVYLEGSSATLEHNTIQGNASFSGGGVNLSGSAASLKGNTIRDNQAASGGGLYLVYSNATSDGDLISHNTASRGGGLYLYDSSPSLTNTVVADNRATWRGAGLYLTSASRNTAPRLAHPTLARNTGGDGSGVHVVHEGQGYHSQVDLTNAILVSHTLGITVSAGNTATLNATLWHANDTDWSGNVIHSADHTGDPAFAPDGYHLTGASAALDVGVDAGVDHDIDGQTRPQEAGYDVGADEFICLGLSGVSINGPTSGVVDTPYTFSADVTPADANQPITYTWSPEPDSGQGTASVRYTWTTSGTQTINLTVENCGGSQSDSHQIAISPPPSQYVVYLPIVVRNQ